LMILPSIVESSALEPSLYSSKEKQKQSIEA